MTLRMFLAEIRRLQIIKSMLCLCFLIQARPACSAQDEKIKLGVVIPLSGLTATYGIDCLAGINLAVEQVNAEGGIKGRKLVLEVRDNQGDPLRTAQEVKSLAEGEALAVIGAVTSNNTLAAATVAQNEGIPLLTPYATYAAVTEVGEFISRICFIDLQQASAMASYSYNALGLRRIAILSEQGSRYSQSLAEYFSDRFRQLGGQIVADRSYRSSPDDVIEALRQFKPLAPDAIFIPVYYTDAARIAKEVMRLGACNTLLGGDGWESAAFFQLAGDTLKDQHIYITSHFSAEDPRSVVQKFVTLFRNKNGRNPNALAALAYDAGLVLADALSRAPQVTRAALKDAINSTNGVEGTTGVITMNEKRDPRKDVYILEARDGGFHLRAAGIKPQ